MSSAAPARRPVTAALCLPPADIDRLSAEAPARGIDVVARCASGTELAEIIPVLRPTIVLAVARAPYFDAALLSACDAAGAQLVVAASSRSEVRHARALGMADTVPAPIAWPTGAGPVAPRGPSLGLVRETSATSADAPPGLERGPAAPRRGRAIAVWGTDGAPGRTSIAIALAAELARTGARVALADADVVAASVAPALGLLDEAPGFAAACRLAGLGSLNRDEFERLAERVPVTGGAVRVLTGIAHPNRWPELTAERVMSVIEHARDWVDVLVLDVAASIEAGTEPVSDLRAPSRNAATIASLRAADEVVMVGAGDPIGAMRLIRSRAAAVETLEIADPLVVINKVRSSVTGIGAESQLRHVLARFANVHDPTFVPWDQAAFDLALLTERPLSEAAPRSRAGAAIRALAASWAPEPAPTTRGRGAQWRRRRLA